MKEALRRQWDWYAVFLLLTMVSTAAVRLSVTDWTSGIGYVEMVATLGVILGVTLGYSQFGRRSVWWLALSFTVIVIPWQMAHVVTGETTVPGILGQEWTRLGAALQQIAARQPVYDPIFFITVISSLYWWIGLYCGYRLIRGTHLFSIILPPTIPALIVQYYDGNEAGRIWILAFYFVLLLLLMGRINTLRSREKWASKRVFSGSDSEFDLARSVLAVAAILVIICWALPAPSAALPTAARLWQQINEPYQSTIDWVNQTLDALQSRSGNGLQAYGNTLGLGVRANQSLQTVFRVTPPGIDFPRYYWQMRIYDTYEDGNWSNSHQNWSRGFAPDNGNLPVYFGGIAQTASFGFRWEGNASTLLAAPSQPIWASLKGTIQYEDAQPGQIDITSWDVDPYLQAGAVYTARAELLNPSIAMLREAGVNYPQWVTERYLQTPASLPNDIRVLAQDLTGEKATPYDKASAITDYLRKEIKYSPNIAMPPPGTDPLDWFLFTWKSGYCNYYATAEVMMLRSSGIPARLAVGYAEGTREKDPSAGSGQAGTFTVRGRDSHAWPQVYFPAIGWVDFEPTAGQPALVRPVGSADQANPPAPTDRGQAVQPPRIPQDGQALQSRDVSIAYRSIGVWVIILVIVLAAGYGIRLLNRKKALGRRIPHFVRAFYEYYRLNIPPWLEKWERWSDSTLVERSFHAINQSLAWLGKPQPPHATPAERAELLKTLLPALAEEIDNLKKEHENTLFSPTPGDPVKAGRAAWMIRSRTALAILRRLVGVKDE